MNLTSIHISISITVNIPQGPVVLPFVSTIQALYVRFFLDFRPRFQSTKLHQLHLEWLSPFGILLCYLEHCCSKVVFDIQPSFLLMREINYEIYKRKTTNLWDFKEGCSLHSDTNNDQMPKEIYHKIITI
mgnify:CR=1 FL=1